MRTPRYPLESLAHLRDHRVEQAKKGLRHACDERQASANEMAARQEAQEAHARRVKQVSDAEREALEQGVLRAADLMAGGAFAARESMVEQKLVREVDAAKTAHDVASRAEATARSALAFRQADAKVVERDRNRWKTARDARTAAREEEDAVEAWRPRKP